MPANVASSWSKLESWLQIHAPRSYSGLRPPAESKAITDAESTLGFAFPEDFRTSLLRHDGSGSDPMANANNDLVLPGNFSLIPLNTIIGRWTMLVRILEEDGYPDEVGSWFHPAWIPFADNGATDALVIDARTGPDYGRIGFFLHDDQTHFEGFSSYAEFLAATVEGLENGTDVDSTYAEVDEQGHLAWAYHHPSALDRPEENRP